MRNRSHEIFNEITRLCGIITEICVENQQAVEYNQVLFKVDPSLEPEGPSKHSRPDGIEFVPDGW